MDINKNVEMDDKEMLKILLEEVLKINQKLDLLLQPLRVEVPKSELKWDEEFPLKTRNDEVLAICQIKEDRMKIVLQKRLRGDLPPFEGFLVNRILEPIKQKNSAFIYHVFDEEGFLREISFQGLNGRERKEVISATRWTLERMIEKQKA